MGFIEQSLAEYHKRFEAIRADYNRTWNQAYGDARVTCPHCGQVMPENDEARKSAEEQHRANAKATDAQKVALRDEMLRDPNVRHLVCTHTITFMGKRDISHYDIDQKITAQFPTVVCDSESGQGFCYVPAALIAEVTEFIKPWVSSSRAYETDSQFWTVNWRLAKGIAA